jgi:acyl-coenzyme A synthetase/AMP-(fatty) acid ligase
VRTDGLISGFLESAQRFPFNDAVFVNGRYLAYRDLEQITIRIAAAIRQREQTAYPLAAVFAYRSQTAYGGILGVLAAGKGYVPLNPKLPTDRTRKLIDLSGVSTVVVGNECAAQLPRLLAGISRPLTVLLPDVADVEHLGDSLPHHQFVSANELTACNTASVCAKVDQDAVAYLLFTSGSTGEPKGVPISHASVRAYIRYTAVSFLGVALGEKSVFDSLAGS